MLQALQAYVGQRTAFVICLRPHGIIAAMLKGKVALVTGMRCWPPHTQSVNGRSFPQQLALITTS